MDVLPQHPLASSRNHKRLFVFVFTLMLIVIAFALDYAFYPWDQPLPGGPGGNKNENGLWVRYKWYFGEHTPVETERLAHDLSTHQIRYAYFHVRYIGKSGNLRYRYPDSARRLNAIVHRTAPEVKTIAWIYVGNTRGIGSLKDLSDAALRQRMVAEARFLVTECGFDGIQWDYEICSDKDQGLLSLLEETRAALPKGKTLSIATALWAPGIIPTTGYAWSEEYFAQIAARCDQICVMGYDSAIYLPRTYAWLMAEQTRHVCSAVAGSANTSCRVLIGVPTYGKGGPSHHAHAENLSIAVRGVRMGYADLTEKQRAVFAGIAPFADYTTDANEWQVYNHDWLHD